MDETSDTDIHRPDLSILGQLEQRHKSIVAAQTKDIRIDGWSNPELWVRYHPVEHAVAAKARNAALGGSPADLISGRKLRKNSDATQDELDANMDVLAAAIVGVYAKLPDDPVEYSLRPDDPTGPLTLFDEDLAANINIEPFTVRRVIRKLFLTDGAILAHAGAVTEFSGYVDVTTEDDPAGE